jgi:hypothetical protein
MGESVHSSRLNSSWNPSPELPYDMPNVPAESISDNATDKIYKVFIFDFMSDGCRLE